MYSPKTPSEVRIKAFENRMNRTMEVQPGIVFANSQTKNVDIAEKIRITEEINPMIAIKYKGLAENEIKLDSPNLNILFQEYLDCPAYLASSLNERIRTFRPKYGIRNLRVLFFSGRSIIILIVF